jgi:hypothetical protein
MHSRIPIYRLSWMGAKILLRCRCPAACSPSLRTTVSPTHSLEHPRPRRLLYTFIATSLSVGGSAPFSLLEVSVGFRIPYTSITLPLLLKYLLPASHDFFNERGFERVESP